MKVDENKRALTNGRRNNKNRATWLNKPTIFRRTCLSSLLIANFGVAVANPTAPQVVFGQVNFNTQGNTLTVTNSPNAIIDWGSFSINPGELTRFLQQNPNSSVLNRITGQNPTQILGTLQSNGKVFLINPNGVLFGAGAKVDVNGLVASSLNISNADFLAGKRNFNVADSASSGVVSNKGSITTPSGGQVYLIAPNVENSGIITSPKGEILLAAGRSVRLVDSANPDLHVVLSAPDNGAVNLGQIVADAGRVGIYGALVKQRGVVNANSAVMGENGKIVLKASGDTLLDAGSVTMASGVGGGGDIHLLGERVGLLGDAKVDASGVTGGGTVLVGGDFHGANPAVPNAQRTYVSPTASIAADAQDHGDGGKVAVWADLGTRFYGTISAQGGAHGGNGGLVETSGKLTLDVAGAYVRASARGAGKSGEWLLDPSDVTLVHGIANPLSGGVFDPATSSSVGDYDLNNVLNGGTPITIQTSTGTGGSGNIIINGNADSNGAVVLTNTSGGSHGLTLTAGGTINMHAGASFSGSSGNPLNVSLTAPGGMTLSGIIDNMGGTTTLSGTANLGGSIRNGTLVTDNTFTGSSGHLDGVTLSGTVTLGNSSGLFIDNDLTLANGAILNMGNSSLYFTKAGGTEHLATTGSGTINMANGGLYAGYSASGQTLQIDSGVTVQGYGVISESQSASIVNAGSVVANTASQTLTVSASSLSNSGTLKANAGTLGISQTNWSNTGSIDVASGATANLHFDTSTPGLGTINRAGGSINYSGTLDNANSTLDIGGGGPFGSGGLTSLTGTIKNGSVKSGDSTVLSTTSSATLDGVTLLGNLSLAGGFFVHNSLTLDNGASINLGNSSLYFNASGAEHIATNGAGTLKMAGGTIIGGYGRGDQTLQIDSGVTISGYGLITDSSAITTTNAGTIIADTNGQTLTLSPSTLVNAGSLQANAGTLSIGHINWSNTGSMSVGSSGTLNLAFDTNTAGLGTITRSGGSVNYSGVLNNSEQTLDIGSSGPFGTGGLTSLSGTINGGVLKSSDSTVLHTDGSATLNNVFVTGTLGLSGGFFVNNGITLDDGAVLNLGTGTLYFHDSNITEHIATGGKATINLAGGTVYAGYGVSGQTVQIDSGVTLQGYGVVADSTAATIVNAGTMMGNTSGQTLSISPTNFSNTGTLGVSAGTVTVGHIGWNNTGSMTVGPNSTLNLYVDTTTAGLGTVTRTGGSVNYYGVLDNTNATLDIGGSGPFGIGGLSTLGGTIKNGVLKSGDGSLLPSSNGALDNVQISGTVNENGGLSIDNGLKLDNAAVLNLGVNGSLYFRGTGNQHIATAGSSVINLAGGYVYAGYGSAGQTLQLDSGVTLQGYGYLVDSSVATFNNAGTVAANTSGQTLSINNNTFNNTGTLSASAGTMTVAHIGWSNSGNINVGSGAVLNLYMDTTTAGLGSISRSGGTVNYYGVLDNSSALLDIGGGGIFGAGGLSSLGGTIKNGTLKSGDSTLLNVNSGTLDGVSVSGTLGTAGSVFVKNGLTLNSGAVLDLGNSNVYFNGSGTEHLASTGSGTVNMANATLYAGYTVSGQTLQIDSGVTLQGYGGLYDSTPATVINAGTINANVPGKVITVGPHGLSNTGTLQATGGDLTINQTQWTNTGSIQLGTGSTVNLNFDTTTANLGTITHSAGFVNYSGILDNTAATLDLTASGNFGAGGLNNLGGTVKGGTIVASNSLPVNGVNGTLDGVTVSGTLKANGGWIVKQDLTLANNAVVDQGASNWYFEGTGNQHIATGGTATINLGGGYWTLGYGVTGQTLHIDNGVTVQGQGGIYQSNAAVLSNAGVIDANLAGQTLVLQPGTLNNGGTLKASAGTLAVQPANWSNSGSMSVASTGILNLDFDTTTAGLGSVTRSGGIVNYNGVLDNTSATLDVGGSGQFGAGGLASFSGTLKNGSVTSSDSTLFNSLSTSTFDGVTVSGTLGLSGGVIVKNNLMLANGGTLNLGNSTLYFESAGNQHIGASGNATINSAGAAIYAGYGISGQTLQFDSGITYQGYGGIYQSSPATVINAGLINSQIPGQTLYVSANSVQNTGTMRANGGNISVSGLSSNDGKIQIMPTSTLSTGGSDLTNNAAGVIEGAGTLDLGSKTLTNNGTINPGNSGIIGTLSVTGNFVNGNAGVLNMEASSAATHDVLAISGTATLGGTLNASTINSYTPLNGDNLAFLTYSGNASATFATINSAAFAGATADYGTAGSFFIRMPNGTVLNVWNFDGSGNWSDPTKWSLGHVPTVNEDVQVPDYTSQFTISVAANSQVAKSVVFLGNDKLAVSGGTVSVTNASNFGQGALDIFGTGIYNSGGNLSVKSLNLSGTGGINLGTGVTLSVMDHVQSGGTINGVSNIVIGNSFNRTGGTIDTNITGLSITQSSGNLVPGLIAIHGPVSLAANNGDININAPIAVPNYGVTLNAPQGGITSNGSNINALQLVANAKTGIGDGSPLNTQVAMLQASNSGSGNIVIQNVNNGGLAINDLTSTGYGVQQLGQGNVQILTGTGGSLTVNAPVTAAGSAQSRIYLTGPSVTLADSTSAIVDGGNGSVSLWANDAKGSGITLGAQSTVKINGVQGQGPAPQISLTADQMTLSGALDAGALTGAGNVVLSPTSQISLVVDANRGGGNLVVTPNDLANIKGSLVWLGDTGGGHGVTIMDPVTLTQTRGLQVLTDGPLAVNAPVSVTPANSYINLVPLGSDVSVGATGALSAQMVTVQSAGHIDLSSAATGSIGVPGGQVSLQGDHIVLGNNVPVNVGTGLVQLKVNTAGTAIDVVGAPSQVSPNLQLSASEVNAIVAGTLEIGNGNNISGSGTLTVSAPLTPLASALVLKAGCNNNASCGDITQSPGGVITVGDLDLNSHGKITLGAAINMADKLAASVSNGGSGITFVNGKDLEIAAGGNGITAHNQSVKLKAPGLLITEPIDAMNGGVALITDNLTLGGPITADVVGINVATPGRPITVGNSTCNVGPCLAISDLHTIAAGNIAIGSSNVNFAPGAIYVDEISVGGTASTDRNAATTRIDLISSAGIAQNGTIDVANLGFLSGGNVTLGNPGNHVGLLAGSATGDVTFANANAMTVGNLTALASEPVKTGVSASGSTGVKLVVGGGQDLIVAQPINATNGNVVLETDKLTMAAQITTNTASISPATEGMAITVGNTTCHLLPCLSLTSLYQIAAPNVVIGDASSGPIFVEGITVGNTLATDRNAATTRLDLQSLGTITQNGAINISSLGLDAGGSITLTAANQVATLAGNSGGDISFNNAGNLTIGSLAAVGNASAKAGLHAPDATEGINLTLAANQSLTLSQAVTADNRTVAIATDTLTVSGGSVQADTLEIYPTSAGLPITVGSTTCQTGPCLTLPNLHHFDTLNLVIGRTGANAAGAIFVDGITVGGSSVTDRHADTARIDLLTGGSITQNGAIMVQDLGLDAGGTVNLSATNMVVNLAGKSVGDFSYSNGCGLDVGTLAAVGHGSSVAGLTSSTGNLTLTDTAGSIGLGNDLAGKAISITASGSITGSAMITGTSLSANAGGGMDLMTTVSQLTASNTSYGDIVISNHIPLTVNDVTQSGPGAINISNIGATTVAGKVMGTTGDIHIVAHSPLTINGSVISTGGGAIILEAGSNNSNSDNLVISPSAVVTSSGNVTLTAGNTITVSTGSTVSPQAVVVPAQNTPLPGINACITNPALPRCNEVLPDLNSCISNPTALGCSVVLPTLTSCTLNPTASGCQVVLPSLTACTAAPSTPGCSVVLPTLATCTANPAAPGCSAVLPPIATCTANPTAPGCQVVLPSLATCTITPSTPGCSAVLPSITVCTAVPATPGCTAVLPTLATCTANPAAPGCSAVLPSLASCITNPTAPGCSVVLPNVATCTANPTAPGCSVVLPNLNACISQPSTPGCSAVLPSLSSCLGNSSLPGCSVVLPTLVTCTAAPATPGCSVILPSLATCTVNPATPGCSAVLPTLANCTATPSIPGCSAVLPTLASCLAAPATPGCSAVLPTVATCIATPDASGCSVVLPNLASCISAPSTPGCSVVLPTVATCTAAPSTPGCSVTLPNLASCIAGPSLPGCSAVLPALASCIANPAADGCSVVLPTIATCSVNPAAPGCSVVLPNLGQCISNPALAGCAAILPTLASCTSSPTLPGCSVVLPSVEACTATPGLPGCSAVLPTVVSCLTNPAAAGCQTGGNATTTAQDTELSHALNNTVEIVTSVTVKPVTQTPVVLAQLAPPASEPPAPVAPPATSDKPVLASNDKPATIGNDKPSDSKPADAKPADTKPADSKPDDSKKDDAKKDDKKDDSTKVAAKPETKKEEPAKKLYCN